MDQKLSQMLHEVSAQYCKNEVDAVTHIAKYVESIRSDFPQAQKKASTYIDQIRERIGGVGIEAFFSQYGLDSEEGVAVMTLAESLLRIPDTATANDIIHDKLQDTKWDKNTATGSKAMRLSAFGLKIAGKIFDTGKFVSRLADPVIRESIKHSVRMMGEHFVIGESIEKAFKRAEEYEKSGYLLSYDMLGEGARSDAQAQRFHAQYLSAIEAIGGSLVFSNNVFKRPGISVKLSALYPRFEYLHIDDVRKILLPRLKKIISRSMAGGIAVTIDAEESSRLDLTLEIFTEIVCDNEFKGYEGLGLAVQAYHRNAINVVEYIIQLAKHCDRVIPVRLVKGAYWDSEVKNAQMQGLQDYPVFMNKGHTDLSYIACAYKLLENNDVIYPQFATHNALTVAEIEQAASGKIYEFQRLFGMGKGLYDQIVPEQKCRIYAPVGEYKELLPYLIRRLLENSANSSFVKKVANVNYPARAILEDPLDSRSEASDIVLPLEIYESARKNSSGVDLGNKAQVATLNAEIKSFAKKSWASKPMIDGEEYNSGLCHDVISPYDLRKQIGKRYDYEESHIEKAMQATVGAHEKWSKISVDERAQILEKMADLLEENRGEAISLCVFEAGKTIADAVAEIREAIDFCRYYAEQARKLFKAQYTKGPTGETNYYSVTGRGVFVCISPWNFPLAIFLGQVSAALVAGNCVIAKPAEQTSLIASFAVKLLFKAGVPKEVISLLPGDGAQIGKILLSDKRVGGVVFTGSIDTANTINSTLAQKGAPIVPFIAETGGQNAMIVDSSALIEQTVDDVLLSAFGSAGQRCSALRVLYLQEDIADEFIETLSGAISQLRLGSPEDFASDLASVIDSDAQNTINSHIYLMEANHQKVAAASYNDIDKGHFILPHIFEIDSINDLDAEVFGPVLHVIRFAHKDLDRIIDEINDYGSGLTFGIQTRINSRVEYISKRIKCGNIYVNRAMTGATVGVQPFGGEGVSGTGPKAGGPHYLHRFVTERVCTVNTVAIGGNKDLLLG